MPKSNAAAQFQIKFSEDAPLSSISEILAEYRKLNEQCDQVIEKMAKRNQSK